MIKKCSYCLATFETDFAGRTLCEKCQDSKLHANAIVTNEQGGSQSRLDFDFTQLDADMLMRVAKVLAQGAQKYGEKNWQKISTHDHINHMIYHAIMANTNDTTEDHLANTICRAMFAMWSQTHVQLKEFEPSFPPIVSGVTQSQLDAMLKPPPFGYRKFDTYPSDKPPSTDWCYQCQHDAKSHITTPHIDGDVLTCAKCNCRQQLQEGEHWCGYCKHPMAKHDELDGAIGCKLCSCIVYKPQENICTCGHHLIAHEFNDYSGRIDWGHCRTCSCIRFVPATALVKGQGTE